VFLVILHSEHLVFLVADVEAQDLSVWPEWPAQFRVGS
jgi:hypothetical protein